MKISNRQHEEIEFFSLFASPPFVPTIKEMEEYIDETVNGNKTSTERIMNRISQSKRSFDITIKMWRKDLVNGLLGAQELYEDYGNHVFGKRLIDSIVKSLDFSKFEKNEGYLPISVMNASYKDKLKHHGTN